MNVRVNGEPATVADGASVADLLATQSFAGGSVVVAINEVFVPRPLYETKLLNDNDRVEILGPMQGG
ncbi:MAG: thiamine biosynthesis protein ThiS [Candidatus Promineifilaceae bacterium]|jgi:thiamine biosynthesis protein ThiS